MKNNLFPRILAGTPAGATQAKQQPLPWLLTNYKKELQNGKTTANQLSKTV
jgi:hypothetical protein